MKQISIKFLVLILTTFILGACSHRLTGTWTVDRYETTNPREQAVILKNIGTIQFYKDGTGEKKLSYSVLGIKRNDQTSFKWTWDDGKYVSIESEGSDFAKTWIVIENKRKYQRWKSTDGASRVQTVELKK